MSKLTLTDVAERINAYLKAFENDPKKNKKRRHGDSTYSDYFNAWAGRSGNRVYVTYMSYQGASSLKPDEAREYLEWLDAGNVGTHQIMRYENHKAEGGAA